MNKGASDAGPSFWPWRRRARAAAAEAEARAAGERARLLLEATEDGIYALDPEGRCLWANPAAARLFGHPGPEDLVGRQMHAVIHHTRADGSPFPEEECGGLKNLRAGEGVKQSQELLWRADGSSFYADVRVNPIFRNGEMSGAVVVCRDLTERLRLEEQYRRAHKIEAVGRLAAGIAHDFNNLLSVVQGHAELLLLRPEMDAGARQRLAAIRDASDQAARLTGQLLAFSRRQMAAPSVVRLNEVVRAAEEEIRRRLEKNQSLVLELGPDLASALADAEQIEQALLSLAANAREAMPEGGWMRLRTANVALPADEAAALGLRPGEYATLSVADTGRGMDEATRRRVFEPFFTTKPAGSEKGGGLGLALALAAAQQCGGTITLASQPGRGAVATIYLPALGGAARSAAAALSAAEKSPRPR